MNESLTLMRPDARLRGERAGTGPAALLLHAGGEHRGVWRPIMRILADHGRSSTAFDQRGHGESGADSGERIEAFGDDAAAMIRRMFAPVVVGASLGGFSALMALRDEEIRAHVSGLILVDVVPDPDPGVVRPFLAAIRGDLVQSALVQDIFDHAETLRRSAAGLDLPVRLVRAKGQTPLSDEAVAGLVELIPSLRIVEVEGAGHLVARDAPAALADIIVGFLNDDAVRDRRISQLLMRCGCANIVHPGGTLLQHLHRIGDVLRAWGADSVLVDAGRLHAAYGTDGFDAPFVRDAEGLTVEAAAGSEVASLVGLYCRCDRRASYPTWSTDTPLLRDRTTGVSIPLDSQLRAMLMHLTVANELDVLAHDREMMDRHGATLHHLFSQWRPFLRDGAVRAIDTTLRDS